MNFPEHICALWLASAVLSPLALWTLCYLCSSILYTTRPLILSPPTTSTSISLETVVLRTGGLGAGGEVWAVYRNWSGSIHQLCLELRPNIINSLAPPQLCSP